MTEAIGTRQFNRLNKLARHAQLKGTDKGSSRALNRAQSEQPTQAPLFDVPDDERARFNARAIASLPRIEGQLNQRERQLLAELRRAGYEARALIGCEFRTGSEWRIERQKVG